MEEIAGPSTQAKTNFDDIAEVKQETDSKTNKPATPENEKKPPQYFQCSYCPLNEKFEYFGDDPSFAKAYKLLENSYVIEDPFLPPKQGQFIILGAHCIKCNKTVCKDSNCSFYFDGTYCIKCAKYSSKTFPHVVQEKLNRIVIS